jgi:2-amino-4-hydroxy-6-hydroxymethyldihydropteridine diphosphokinase
MAQLYLSLGTNLGDRRSNLDTALDLIAREVGIIKARSGVIETEPWGFDSPNSFLNMTVLVQTDLKPLEVLDRTQRIEKDMGRTSKTGTDGYHDRIIDIDILLYDDLTMNTPKLTIPHPRMYQRRFVMEPLAQIAPHIVKDL